MSQACAEHTLIDSHCHLDDPRLLEQGVETLLKRAKTLGVRGCVTISTRTSHYKIYADLAERYLDYNVFFSIGTHPAEAFAESDVTVETLCALASHPRCIAIGECGLDYYHCQTPPDVQKSVFLRHIQASQDTQLPLIIHARYADQDMIDCLKKAISHKPFPAILHCFSSGLELAEVGIDLGCYISFSGIITFKKSQELRDIAARVPLNRLLVETDAPFLSPEPYRGKVNEPARVVEVCQTLADVKGISFESMAQQTTTTFLRVFSKIQLVGVHI
jgi:TatD DNase family protein